MVSLMQTRWPGPQAEKHPHNMMLPPPCSTVGMVLRGLNTSGDHFGGIVTKQFKSGLIQPDDFPPVVLRVIQVVMGELEALLEVSFGFQGDLPGVSSLETIASQCPGDSGQ